MKLTKKLKSRNTKKTKKYQKGGANLNEIRKIIDKFKKIKKITIPTLDIALELTSPNLIKKNNIYNTKKTKINNVIKKYFGDSIKETELDELYYLLIKNQDNNKTKYLQELANKLKQLLENRKKLKEETNESNTDEDECEFEYFDDMQHFIDEMKKYIDNSSDLTFYLDKSEITAEDILYIIYNIFVKNNIEINVNNIDLSELKKKISNCDFEEEFDNFDNDLKNACKQIYDYYKQKKISQNSSILSRRNSGYNSTSRRNSIKSSITEQPSKLPTNRLTCNNLQNTINSTSNSFFEVLGESKVLDLRILPTNHQNILKDKFLEIFTKACTDINEAKNLKQKLESNYNIDILYTLYHIFIIDHLQYSNIHIYSNDDVISEHYGTNPTENSKNNKNNNNNIKKLKSFNKIYLNLAKNALEKYNKLTDKIFYKFKKQLIESHNIT